MINTDSYYQIGAGHTFCQDYARSGSFEARGGKFYYSVVCDGCSASSDSDIAARILAKLFANKAEMILISVNEEINGALLHTWFVNSIYGIKRDECLDATIVGLLYDEKQDVLHSFIWGDGKIVYKYKGQESGYLTDISYKSNAPFYISYLRESAAGNNDLVKKYEKEFGTEYGIRQGSIVTPTKLVEVPETRETGVKFHYEKYPDASKTLAFASVFSDGIDTFHKKEDPNLTMAKHVLYGDLVGYKNFNGEFVKRRMLAFKKQCAKDGWQSFDDFAVGTISFMA